MLSGNVAALTFDDGPNPETAPRLLEVLVMNEAKAVFCLIGDYVSYRPWRGRLLPRAIRCATTACTTRAVSAAGLRSACVPTWRKRRPRSGKLLEAYPCRTTGSPTVSGG